MNTGGPISTCPECKVPTVFTFASSGYEYYCLDCGDKYGMFETPIADPTPELVSDMEARRIEFRDNAAADLLVVGAYRKDCERCTGYGKEPHILHATSEEKAAHDKAVAWLEQRKKT